MGSTKQSDRTVMVARFSRTHVKGRQTGYGDYGREARGGAEYACCEFSDHSGGPAIVGVRQHKRKGYLMNIETLGSFFMWCTIINAVIYMVWCLQLAFCPDFVFRRASKWFRISRESCDTISYASLAFMKVVIFLFNLAPFLALKLIG